MLISKKKKQKNFILILSSGWVGGGVCTMAKKKKKIVPAIKTIYFPIVKKLNLREEEEENYKITKLQKSNHIGRRCITNINLCL